MTFAEVSPIYKMVIQTVLVIVLAMQIYEFMSFVFVIKRWKESLAQLVGIFINIGILTVTISEYQYILHGRAPSEFILNMTKIRFWELILFGAAMIVLSLGAAMRLNKLKNQMITTNSIKEGTDDIPMGICYARKDGMPILVNRKMYTLSLEMMGSALQNARHFWEQIVRGELPEGIQKVIEGDEPAILLSDGTVWTFSKQYVQLKGEEIVQLIAVDTTDLYQLSLELEDKNRSLREMNIRLQDYSDNVTELMREEEILAAKVKIHADIGSSLLATRYYLSNPRGEEQAEALIKSWNYNISMLYNEAKTEQKEDVFVHLNAAAEAVGVTVEVHGKLPKGNVKAERLIVAAARECLTNTVRHGDGDKVMIHIREDKHFYHVEYTNNGTEPEEKIKEGGGLLGLRKRIEDIGGNMQIISTPQFVLMINIPKERR